MCHLFGYPLTLFAYRAARTALPMMNLTLHRNLYNSNHFFFLICYLDACTNFFTKFHICDMHINKNPFFVTYKILPEKYCIKTCTELAFCA